MSEASRARAASGCCATAERKEGSVWVSTDRRADPGVMALAAVSSAVASATT